MELHVDGDLVARETTQADIENAIRGLRINGDDSFAILSLSENGFVQSVYSDNGYGLEYKKDDDLFGCYDELGEADVIKAFVYYLNRDERLNAEFSWERVNY